MQFWDDIRVVFLVVKWEEGVRNQLIQPHVLGMYLQRHHSCVRSLPNIKGALFHTIVMGYIMSLQPWLAPETVVTKAGPQTLADCVVSSTRVEYLPMEIANAAGVFPNDTPSLKSPTTGAPAEKGFTRFDWRQHLQLSGRRAWSATACQQ